jgi:phosphodiesterase/alkaline phosphatase D-like protein
MHMGRWWSGGELQYVPFCSYIYETERNASELILPQYRAARAHFPAKEILSVSDYRARHNQYSEPLLGDKRTTTAAASTTIP